MSAIFGMPGPGGSLGTCALCGECFLAEIVMGKSVKSITVQGCKQTLFAHDKCIKKFHSNKTTMLDLPAASPLRQLYEKQQAEKSVPVERRQS